MPKGREEEYEDDEPGKGSMAPPPEKPKHAHLARDAANYRATQPRHGGPAFLDDDEETEENEGKSLEEYNDELYETFPNRDSPLSNEALGEDQKKHKALQDERDRKFPQARADAGSTLDKAKAKVDAERAPKPPADEKEAQARLDAEYSKAHEQRLAQLEQEAPPIELPPDLAQTLAQTLRDAIERLTDGQVVLPAGGDGKDTSRGLLWGMAKAVEAVTKGKLMPIKEAFQSPEALQDYLVELSGFAQDDKALRSVRAGRGAGKKEE